MKTWRVAVVLALAASVSWAMPALGQTLGVYDDFNSGPLDPQRWHGYEYSIHKFDSHPEALYGTPDWEPTALDPVNLDSLRRVVGGQAQIALTTFRGFSGSLDEGGARARSGLRVSHLALADHKPVVTALQAKVTVVSAAVPTISPETEWCRLDVGTARAEIFGHFFNDGTSSGPRDLTGDVVALVRLSRQVDDTDSGEVVLDVVEAQTGRCTNADCSRIRWGAAVAFDRTWSIGVAHVLTIAWQPASDAFVFTVAGGGVTESQTVTYTVADATRARAYAYDVRVETRPRRCYAQTPSTPPQQIVQQVSIDARFDNVRLNSAAATATR